MNYQKEVFTEAQKMSDLLESNFPEAQMWFISASLKEIKYGFKNDIITFHYSDER